MNSVHRILLPALILVAIIGGGCSSRSPQQQAVGPEIAKVRLDADPAELLQALQKRNAEIKTLRTSNAEFQYRFTNTKNPYDGTGIRFAVEKPGKLYARASATAVGDIFFLHSDGKRYWVEATREEKLYMGKVDDSRRMQVVTEKDLWRNLTPQVLAEALLIDDLDGYDKASFAIEPDFYIISLFTSDDDGRLVPRRKIWVGREDLRVNRHKVFNQFGELTTEAFLYQYKSVDGVDLPHYFRIERHWESISIRFTLEDIVLNSELRPGLFIYDSPPANFEVIELDKRDTNAEPGQS